MHNTERQVIQALIEVGSITPDRVAAGLCVVGAGRRNQVWIVRAAEGPSLVVKHATDRSGQRRLAREAAVYRHLSKVEGIHAPFLPRPVCYDARRGMLIVEHVDGPSLAETITRRDHNATASASVLGRTLAHLHQTGIDPLDLIASNPPWVLRVHRPDLGWYTTSSEASLRMRAIIQQQPTLESALDSLRAGWTAGSFIHGDLKLEHVIATRATRRKTDRISFIDWESAQLGDAAWDIGTVFAGFLLRWLRSIPLIAGRSAAETVNLASVSIDRIQQPGRAFWQAYADTAGHDATGRRQLLRRSAQFAAASLIQREEEYLQSASAPGERTRLILQVSESLLARPDDGAATLLGLDTAGGAR